MANKSRLMASVCINNAVRDELLWFAKHARNSNGIFLLQSIAWDPTLHTSDTMICFTDACLDGMAYWFPQLNLGFQFRIPDESQTHHIFYYEALTVTCAILDKHHNLSRIILHSDNQNMVDIWHSLEASPPYNQLLMLTIDGLIDSNTDARILHVPRTSNTVADTLSHFNNMLALQLAPQLHISTFQPPQGTLGAAKK